MNERYCCDCIWWHKAYGCTYNYPNYWYLRSFDLLKQIYYDKNIRKTQK